VGPGVNMDALECRKISCPGRGKILRYCGLREERLPRNFHSHFSGSYTSKLTFTQHTISPLVDGASLVEL
jgi:hypothetical protein